ncbi:MAG: hypothetical protein RLY82_1217, partial [Pseudomonadota bacterium]
YTAGTDTLIDLGDAFRDDNENGVYDSGEFIISKGGSSSCTNAAIVLAYAANGYGGTEPARANTCTGLLAGVVRRQIIIFFSSDAVVGSAYTVAPFTSTTANTFEFYLSSFGPSGSLLPLPFGTTVSAVVTSPAAGCSVSDLFPTTIGNSTNTGTAATLDVARNYHRHSVTLTGTPLTTTAAAVACSGGNLRVTYTTSVSGTSSTINIAIP